MSTKLRILVKKRGHKPMTGTKAIKFLCSVVQSRMLRVVWPVDWDQLSMKDKLSFLAKYLPNDTKLMLIREPKWTRKNRSLYIRLIKKWRHLKKAPGDNSRREEEEFPDPFDELEVEPDVHVSTPQSQPLPGAEIYSQQAMNTLNQVLGARTARWSVDIETPRNQ